MGSMGCGPRDAVAWCPINRDGYCQLDTASFEDMDSVADRCGNIGVNDRYLIQKYGVPYKDLNCGNCSYYEAGEHSYGICQNEQVKMHLKGLIVDGEKEYFRDAKACKKFRKREGEEMPTYWTLPESCADCDFTPVKGTSTCNTILVDQTAAGKCGWYRNTKTGEIGPLKYQDEYGKPMPDTVPDPVPVPVTKSEPVKTFDYSAVGTDLTEFLQAKAARITEIRVKSVVSIGKELKDVHSKLAKHYGGTFGLWVESIGISRQTAQNYITAYDWVVKNFDNVKDAENIQPSLLFAVSKPSADPAIAERAITGDITTYKEYQILKTQLEEAKAGKTEMGEQIKRYYKEWQDAEYHTRTLSQDLAEAAKRQKDLMQQLDQAKRNTDPTKVREMGEQITKYRQEIEELRSRPVDVAVKEVVPEGYEDYTAVQQIIATIRSLSMERIIAWSMLAEAKADGNADKLSAVGKVKDGLVRIKTFGI